MGGRAGLCSTRQRTMRQPPRRMLVTVRRSSQSVGPSTRRLGCDTQHPHRLRLPCLTVLCVRGPSLRGHGVWQSDAVDIAPLLPRTKATTPLALAAAASAVRSSRQDVGRMVSITRGDHPLVPPNRWVGKRVRARSWSAVRRGHYPQHPDTTQ